MSREVSKPSYADKLWTERPHRSEPAWLLCQGDARCKTPAACLCSCSNKDGQVYALSAVCPSHKAVAVTGACIPASAGNPLLLDLVEALTKRAPSCTALLQDVM